MLRLIPLISLLLAGCLAPGAPAADPLFVLLAGRRVVYADPRAPGPGPHPWQEWGADGTTTWHGVGLFGGPSSGRWVVRNGLYCEMRGRQTEWTCWRMTTSDGGQRTRFQLAVAGIGDLIFARHWVGHFAD